MWGVRCRLHHDLDTAHHKCDSGKGLEAVTQEPGLEVWSFVAPVRALPLRPGLEPRAFVAAAISGMN